MEEQKIADEKGEYGKAESEASEAILVSSRGNQSHQKRLLDGATDTDNSLGPVPRRHESFQVVAHVAVKSCKKTGKGEEKGKKEFKRDSTSFPRRIFTAQKGRCVASGREALEES